MVNQRKLIDHFCITEAEIMHTGQKIKLVRISDWLVPFDHVSYKALQVNGISHTRIKRDVMDTVYGLRLQPKGIELEIIEFSTVWVDFLGNVASRWKRIPSTKFTNSARTVTMDTLHAAVRAEVEPQVEKIERCFDRFFSRWGSSYQFSFSESRGKLRIHVEFRHGVKNPVLEITRKPSPVRTLDFGNTRIDITDDPKIQEPKAPDRIGKSGLRVEAPVYVALLEQSTHNGQ